MDLNILLVLQTIFLAVCLLIYFLKEKFNTFNATKRFLANIAPYGKIKTSSFCDDVFPSEKVKRVCSDSWGEYLSK